MTNDNDKHLQEINEDIYKRNLELAVVNKTLSLLRKLYQITLQSLDPASLSVKVAETVSVDLNMELVGVFLFDEKADTLKPYPFAKSNRLTVFCKENNCSFDNLELTQVSKKPYLKQVVQSRTPVITNNLEDIWVGVPGFDKLKLVSDQSHLKTTLMYPLVTQNKVIGSLLLILNRDYQTLNHFEKDSINSFIDVIAVALDKALLYEQLKIANEQLKILDQARSEFITIASHQLRTPPATIKWYLASILTGDFGPLSAQIKDEMVKVEVTNNSLIALIDDLLNVSRIERGKLEFSFEPTDLIALTQLTVDQLGPQAKIKKLKLLFEVPKIAFPKVMADKEKLRQVINNLIDNAIKYTKEGQVAIKLIKTDKDLILKVTDTGRGVAPDQVDHLFEKFDRGKEAAKNSTGLGLGLYVGKIVMEQHHGKIWVESEGLGKGSSFCFSIPIENNLTNSVFDLTKNQEH